jgi:hypothetical protein
VSIRFTKVKYRPSEEITEVSYQKPINGGHDKIAVESPQEPHADFIQAMQGLRALVLDGAEIREVADVEEIDVRGINLSYTDETIGVVITAMRKLKKSSTPMLLNTPLRLMSFPDNTPPERTFSDNEIAAIERLLEAAKEFLEGKRAQGDLFEESEEKVAA